MLWIYNIHLTSYILNLPFFTNVVYRFILLSFHLRSTRPEIIKIPHKLALRFTEFHRRPTKILLASKIALLFPAEFALKSTYNGPDFCEHFF